MWSDAHFPKITLAIRSKWIGVGGKVGQEDTNEEVVKAAHMTDGGGLVQGHGCGDS